MSLKYTADNHGMIAKWLHWGTALPVCSAKGAG